MPVDVMAEPCVIISDSHSGSCLICAGNSSTLPATLVAALHILDTTTKQETQNAVNAPRASSELILIFTRLSDEIKKGHDALKRNNEFTAVYIAG